MSSMEKPKKGYIFNSYGWQEQLESMVILGAGFDSHVGVHLLSAY